ncbi:MAG: glycosyltransferase family 39 protein [Candidatus Levybacteria bacterium]|nr:glycosyltransferase family 39 protein [Candidatus Levybacteria bacterium]
MIRFIPLLSFILIFFAAKVTNLGIRLSDTNIYYNIAYQIIHGKILYKDLFFSNFPLFGYISSFYYFITGDNINLFYLTPTIEVIAVAFLIYLTAYHSTKNNFISTISSLLYLFSFMVLSTSDHQTGVFTASLFAVLGFFLFKKNKFLISGALIALSLLTKAYFIPIPLSFFTILLIDRNWKKLLQFSIGFVVTLIIVLLPSLIIAPKQFLNDIFGFSLMRPAGISKTEVGWFFITKDFVFFVLLIFNLLNFKKNKFFAAVSLWGIAFFLYYQDVYYLYLNFIIPFLCLSLYEFFEFSKNKLRIQKLVIPTIIFTFLTLNLYTYISSYRNLQKINDINKIIAVIKKEKPKFLYGVNDITPALLILTRTPPLDNIRDAHEYFFTKGLYDKEVLTNDAISSKTIIIAHGANYPEANVKQDILDGIFNKEKIYKACKVILSVPVQAEGVANRINFFKCY